jgi:hypothetical protein
MVRFKNPQLRRWVLDLISPVILTPPSTPLPLARSLPITQVYKHFTESYTRSTLVEFLDSEELAALEECDSDQFQHGGFYLSAKAASDDAEESAAVNEMLNDAYCHGVGFYQEESKTEDEGVRMALQEMNGDELVDQAFEHRKATILKQARAFEVSRGLLFVPLM